MSAFQLAWNEFNSCTSSTFQDLYTDKEFTDVTLATEDDKQLKAHKKALQRQMVGPQGTAGLRKQF